MSLFFLHPHNYDPKNGNPELMEIITYEPEHNTSEGSEFLDDAIRMVDQPLSVRNEDEDSGHEE
jgi:hypothetical protein